MTDSPRDTRRRKRIAHLLYIAEIQSRSGLPSETAAALKALEEAEAIQVELLRDLQYEVLLTAAAWGKAFHLDSEETPEGKASAIACWDIAFPVLRELIKEEIRYDKTFNK